MGEQVVGSVGTEGGAADTGNADTGAEHEVLPERRRSESTYPEKKSKETEFDPDDDTPAGDEGAEEKPKDTPKDTPKPAPKAKHKIGDKEWDEDELKENLGIAERRKEHVRAANKKFEEAAALVEKEVKPVRALIERLKTDPMALFQLAEAMGVDPKDAVGKYAQQFLENEKLTPEQRAAQERQSGLERREAEIAAREAKIEEERVNRESDGYRQEFAKQVKTVLPKHGLPDDPLIVGEIGRIVAAQIRSGMEPDYDVAAEMEAERIDTLVSTHLDRLSRTPGALAKKYPELAKRLREEDVANATAPRSTPKKPVPSGKPATPKPREPEVTTWEDDVRAERARRYGFKP